MTIKELKKRPEIEGNEKLSASYLQFDNLLTELRKRDIPDELVNTINEGIDRLNEVNGTEKDLRRQLRKTQSSILKLLEKELKLVTKNHYRTMWMALGMTVFGLPIGAAIGGGFYNMAYFAIGLPIGMAIGIAIGTGLDKKAEEEGRQIDLEIK